MEGAYQPYCQACLVPIAVKHYLVECPDYIDERRGCFGRQVTFRGVLGGPSSVYGGPLHQFLLLTNKLDDI